MRKSFLLIWFSLPLLLSHCSFDTTGLRVSGPRCGNDATETGEECDGADLAGQDCVSLGYESGTLACTAACGFDRSGCQGGSAECGNGLVEDSELCDGADLGALTCVSLGFTGGVLACGGDCRPDTSGCEGEACGNGQVDLAEVCDGVDLDGQTCASLGWYGGALACNGDCTFDLAACIEIGRCGDGLLQADRGEQCDGPNLDGQSCTSLGWYGGVLTCATDCSLDLASCAAAGRCGDGLIQAPEGEQCDGAALAGARCRDRGFFGGSLACAASCLYDTTACDPSRLDGSSAMDWARDMVIDAAGNVYVVGNTQGAVGAVHLGGSDIVVVKWNVDGVRQWAAQMGTAASDQGYALLLDSAGALYVTGSVGGALSGQAHQGGADVAVFKLNATTGAPVWHRQYGSTGDDVGRALARDGSDNIYVAGYTTGTIPSGVMTELVNVGNNDLFLMRLTPLGAYSWGQMFGTTGNEFALSLRVFGGKLFISGSTAGALGGVGTWLGALDAFVVRYTFAGARETVLQFGTASDDQGYSLADDGTYLYLTGPTEGTLPGNTHAGGKDLFVTRIDPVAMTRSWTVQRGTSSNEEAYRLVHASGSLFVAGTTPGTFPGNTSAGGGDAYLYRLAATDGAMQSVRQWGSPSYDIAFGIAVDPSGTLCLSGYFEGSFMGDPNQGGADIGVWCVSP